MDVYGPSLMRRPGVGAQAAPDLSGLEAGDIFTPRDSIFTRHLAQSSYDPRSKGGLYAHIGANG